MRTRTKVIAWIGGVLAVAVAGFATLLYVGYKGFVNEYQSPATAYDPGCSKDDASCAVWAKFRRTRPYPYQSVAAKTLPDRSLVVIVSEPSSAVGRAELDALTRTMFGNDLKSAKRMRWYIGIDGWLEDLVLHVAPRSGTYADPLDDDVFRDQIAILHLALFGTTFGGDLENVDDKQAVPIAKTAANFRVTPAELSAWLNDPSLTWRRLGIMGDEDLKWSNIDNGGTIGAFQSSDARLVILTFPTKLLAATQQNPRTLAPLRVPFREFAVASEAVFGGIWTQSGQTAVLARVRTRPLNAIPPLRFETFAILAAQSSDQLAQSYERNTIFAGKLQSGDYELRDWAPVYLSAPLIDTEFGALLNITDQMLKSWSEAGQVEYLYFTYPKPDKFPFDSALSKELGKTMRSQKTLFNWNTNGASVVVEKPSMSLLTATQTGALPVTYGANGIPKSAGGEELFTYEDQSYRYFADLQDPILARVVQYTLLYQIFRAAVGAEGSSQPSSTFAPIPERAKATQLLVLATASLLDGIDAGRISGAEKDVGAKLRDFRAQHPTLDNARIAALLVDRFSPDALRLQEARRKLHAEQEVFNKDVEEYNRLVEIARESSGDELRESTRKLSRMRDALTERQTVLSRKMAQLERPVNDATQPLRAALAEIAEETPLDAIFTAYMETNSAQPVGSIKTPSVVLSWNTKGVLTSTGGHNVDARSIHLQPSSDVQGIVLTIRGDGTPVLRYSPSLSGSVESRASELARAVEHRGERDPDALAKLAGGASRVRGSGEALALPGGAPTRVGSRQGFGRLGGRVYAEQKEFVDDLRAMAENNDCCVFVARDALQQAYAVEANPKGAPPPTVAYQLRDTPSLHDFLALLGKRTGTKSEKAVIFLDESEAHVNALALSVSQNGGATKPGDIAGALGLSTTKQPARQSAIAQRDLQGRSSILRTILGSVETRSRRVLERLGMIEPEETWGHVRVDALEKDALAQILQRADWSESRDGIPTAVKMSFEASIARRPPDLTVVGGFAEEHIASGSSQLRSAHEKAISRIPADGASLAQYLMTVRNELRAMPQSQLKRLILVVEDQETRTLLTMRMPGVDVTSGG